MVQIIKITTPDGKTLTKEVKVRDYDHFLTQLKYKSKRQTNKKVYNRREGKKVNW